MDNQNCYLCGSNQNISRLSSVRHESGVIPLECIFYGLVFLSSVGHITEGHYAESGMHNGAMPDIDSWLKKTAFDDEGIFNL